MIKKKKIQCEARQINFDFKYNYPVIKLFALPVICMKNKYELFFIAYELSGILKLSDACLMWFAFDKKDCCCIILTKSCFIQIE